MYKYCFILICSTQGRLKKMKNVFDLITTFFIYYLYKKTLLLFVIKYNYTFLTENLKRIQITRKTSYRCVKQ